MTEKTEDTKLKTVGCAKNNIELELLISNAKERLKEFQPTLFDLNDEKEDILGKKVEFIDNDIIFSLGGELIFGKIIKDMKCKDYFKKVKIRKLEKRFGYFKDIISGKQIIFYRFQETFQKKKRYIGLQTA